VPPVNLITEVKKKGETSQGTSLHLAVPAAEKVFHQTERERVVPIPDKTNEGNQCARYWQSPEGERERTGVLPEWVEAGRAAWKGGGPV